MDFTTGVAAAYSVLLRLPAPWQVLVHCGRLAVMLQAPAPTKVAVKPEVVLPATVQ